MPSPRLVVPVGDLVRTLAADRRFGPCVETVRQVPAAEARCGTWPPGLAAEVRAAAERLGIERLFTHQAEAVALALDGHHVAVATGTASGKSLCYQLPVLDALVRAPEARALLLFPTKALAHDQLAALVAWDRALPGVDLQPGAYDGDTPTGARGQIRRDARVLITNPDMLHAGILPHHTRWAALFQGLTHVVVDEMHVYRGVFGSHVANVLRRLRRIARFYGAEPCFILTSATIANPAELATRLAGAPVDLVDDDGSPHGRRWFVLYNPPVVDERLNVRRSVLLEADAVARHFLGGGVQTIVFAQSRRSTELIVRYINEGLAASGDAEATAAGPGGDAHGRGVGASPSRRGHGHASPGPPVRGYRGGYTPSERRAIEAALRDGRLRGVVATTALELGIDIGQLDVCVMAGYPGTVASTRQQSGRAGRRVADAAGVLVAGSSPLDQFMVRHPDYLLGTSPEHARINPDNLLILLDHVRCAAFELSFGPDEAARPFGADPAGMDASGEAVLTGAASETVPAPETVPPVADLLAVLEAQAVVRHVGGTWYWLADAYPAEGVGLRTTGPSAVTIVVARDGGAAATGDVPAGSGGGRGDAGRDRAGNRGAVASRSSTLADNGGDLDNGRSEDAEEPRRFDVLGTVERAAAPLFVHPGAIYLHDGQTYHVASLDWEAGRAVVTPVEPAVYTRAISRVDIRPTRVDGTRTSAHAEVIHGELEVTSQVTGYRRLRFKTHETVGWDDVEMPAQTNVAGAYWVTLDDDAVSALQDLGHWQGDRPADRGPDWLVQRDRARARDGYRCRLCNAVERPGRAHDVHHVRPFRDFGWERTTNDAYRDANDLDNLITLCPSCHRVAERAFGLHGGLSGVGYALRHIAPLYLMCDPRDLDVSTDSHAPWTGRPTVAIYERAAGGVGFGTALFALHERLVAGSADLIATCPCTRGCPSCVGPAGESGPDAKAHALAVLRTLRG